MKDYQIHLSVAASVPGDLVSSEKLSRNRHLAFSVTDLAAAKDQLLAHSCLIQMSASGRPALFTQDPAGNVIKLSHSYSKDCQDTQILFGSFKE